MLTLSSFFVFNRMYVYFCVCTLRATKNWSQIPCMCMHTLPIKLILILILSIFPLIITDYIICQINTELHSQACLVIFA